MPAHTALTEEVSNSKVAGIFANEPAARAEADRLRAALQLSDAQVQVITPSDPRPGHKLEPESHGIFRTMIRAHVVLGLLVAFGAVAGLMFGGLVTLRPDHDPFINRVREALGEGRSAVVVHAFSREQNAQARELLQHASDDVVSTL